MEVNAIPKETHSYNVGLLAYTAGAHFLLDGIALLVGFTFWAVISVDTMSNHCKLQAISFVP